MRCNFTYDCTGTDSLKTWHQHLYRTGHKETIRFTCEYCGAIFDREEFYQNHPCTKNKEADIEWTTYVLKESESKLVQFLISSGRKEYEVADICLEEKFAIPNFWPPVNCLKEEPRSFWSVNKAIDPRTSDRCFRALLPFHARSVGVVILDIQFDYHIGEPGSRYTLPGSQKK